MNGPVALLVVGAPLLALSLYALGEVTLRADLSGARKLAWVAALLVPGIGLAIYVVLRPTRALYAARPTADLSVAERIVRAAERRQRGELTDAEYLREVQAIAIWH